MRKISYNEILLRLYENTDIQNFKINESLLVRKIKQFDKDINGVYSIKITKIKDTIENNMIDIPRDAFNIDFILLGDKTSESQYFINSDLEHAITINITEYSDNDMIYKVWSDISIVNDVQKIDYVISDGKIHFDPYYDGQEITIFYSMYPVNEKGEFLVNENHSEAIIAAIKYFLFDREMFKRKMMGGRLTNDDYSFIRQLYSEKNILIRNARVQDLKENEQYLDRGFINMYNVMIQNDIY